jgi:hypothetical protein
LLEESAFIVAERNALRGGARGKVTIAQAGGSIKGRGTSRTNIESGRGGARGKCKKRKDPGDGDGECSARGNTRRTARGTGRDLQELLLLQVQHLFSHI